MVVETEGAGLAYAGSLEHVLTELERLDVLLRAQVARARLRQRDDERELAAFVVTEAEVDGLLDGPIGTPTWASVALPPELLDPLQARLDGMAATAAERTLASLRQGVPLRLVALAQLFGLSSFDLDVVLVCLAPELDRRYERLYAYLHDDVTRRSPTVDLVLALLCPEGATRVAARQRLTGGAPLVRHRLVQLGHPVHPGDGAPGPTSLLGTTLQLDPRVARFLLDDDGVDDRLQRCTRLVDPAVDLEDLVFPAAFGPRVARLVDHVRSDAGADLVVYLQGGYGVGRQATAEACGRAIGAGLLVVRGDLLTGHSPDELASLALLADREARLQGAVLYWADFDALLGDDQRARLAAVLDVLDGRPGPTFLAGATAWEPRAAWRGATFVRLELPEPGYAERLALWHAALAVGDVAGETALGPDVDLPALAGRFRLSGGQIGDAATTARNRAVARGADLADPADPATGAPRITQDDLHAACRAHSNRRLAELARKITPCASWDDLVLPADQLGQLREIHDQVRHRAVVYDAWGFERKLSLGKGLNVLFAGPPGTGKTMAADVLAHTLRLDLYRIDLSSVVSKYIGETEKNLARIFDEARTSNAILFFDEADALFGKRTQVRDAHDRYANVEISYLLQKMEEYDGVVILATNLRKNMDEAFVRRLHFTVEFPMPDIDDRRRMWAQVWPEPTPRDPGLDLERLARQVPLAGGAIRNIAVAGAFLAAADGGVVTMEHLAHATRREYRKMGKVQTGEHGVVP